MQSRVASSFRLTFAGETTSKLTYGSTTALNIQLALESLSTLAPGDIVVTGEDNVGPFTITFNNLEEVDPITVTEMVECFVEVTEKENYQTILWPLNKPTGYVRFPSADHVLRVRTTALRSGAIVAGWTIVPWYIESSMVMRAPIDYNPPWGLSDQEDLLDTSHKPIFRTWNKYFPQRFSVNIYGYF